ncbi:MAG: S1 family peptidase [Egibacteraceae bacterium]
MERTLRSWAWLMFVLPSVMLLVTVPATPGHGEERTAVRAQDGGGAGAKRVELRLLQKAARSSPTWAGSWRDADGTFVLAFTDRSDDTVHQLLARVGAPAEPVRAQKAQFTLRELRAVDARMYELATSGPGFRTVHAWSVRPERNRVVAYTETTDQARAEFTRAGVDVRKVEFLPTRGQLTYQPLACSRIRCAREPMRGGLGWFSGRGVCTTGFDATRDGVEGFMSAGHCASSKAKVFVGQPPSGTFYGRVVKSAQKSNADALFVQRDSSYPKGAGGIYVSRADPRHTITGSEPSDGYSKGDATCFSGVVTGYECGKIFDASFTDTKLRLRDVVLTDEDACATFGDSGAPFFDGGSTAQGILSGIVVDAADPSERCVHTVYTKLFYDEAATGAQVVTE